MSGEGRTDKVVVRAAAWWLLLVGLSFWLQDYVGDEPPAFGCIIVPWCAKGSSDGAWVFLSATLIVAVELWRLSKVGLIGAVVVLLWLVVAGLWRLAGVREHMAIGFLLVNLCLVVVLARRSAWRTCGKWL